MRTDLDTGRTASTARASRRLGALLPRRRDHNAVITRWIADHGALAIFVLMGIDALLPVGGELIMLYAGVIASGAIAGHAGGADTYVVLALAGSLGYLAGSLIGWLIGHRGGRELIARHGRLLHLSPARFRRAEAWFERHGSRAVFLGRITPLVRSFISVPAGVFGSPLGQYTILTLLGSLLWCFGFAAAGWAAGDSWENLHHAFRYLDYAVVAAVLIATGIVIARTSHL
jgi:membrane protein DedA with SNARE-associated domain